jgi:hypothetical protein
VICWEFVRKNQKSVIENRQSSISSMGGKAMDEGKAGFGNHGAIF